MQSLLRYLFKLCNHALLIGLVVYTVLAGCFVWTINRYPDLGSLDKADGIVVLTGGEERVDMGFKALEEGLATRLLISGVHRDVKLHELMKLHDVDKKYASHVDLGFGAMDTAGNAQEVAVWAQKHQLHNLIVVTSNYHMPRALLHIQSQLPVDQFVLQPLSVTPSMLQREQWYNYPKGWVFLFLAYNKYLLTWPEILLWRYR
jgi:uncharacterized SAM-binding protein YcdF (DUF218 family)